MALSPGTRLGSYEVVGPLGAGGMGEVYRARDTQLNRDVAIKILPDLFSGDAERASRFEREAQTLAALNHPNIAQIYGVERSAARRALVMELVDGEDLSQRIARGALPLDDALAIAKQIAEALEAAHGRGIIHRDLKPANIKVREDGTVKVLDFGLAKAVEGKQAMASGVANSPTFASPVMTEMGLILGTAAYMAPEQAKGKSVDRRADIWAFGVILYEMLTGRHAFAGEGVSDVLASVLRDAPAFEALPSGTPAPLRRLLRRCLAKDPRERLGDMASARLEIADALLGSAEDAAPPAAHARKTPWLPWALAVLATVAGIGAAATMWFTRPAPDTRVYRTVIEPHADVVGAPALRLALSPDGRRVVYVAREDNGRTQLWVRAIDSTSAQPLAGTANASSPFWSPDSRQIAFVADGKLKRIDASGGAAIPICDLASAPPGNWGADGTILVTKAGLIARVPATGGTAVAVATPPAGEERLQLAPFWLPDGRHFLFASASSGSRVMGVLLGSVDRNASIALLPEATSNAMYAQGHIIYARDTTLMARPFDVKTRAFTGDPFVLAEHVVINAATGTAAFSVSQSGSIAYQASILSPGSELAWFDQTGKRLSTLGQREDYGSVALSPDGREAAVTISGAGRSPGDVWIVDVTRGVKTRVTFDPNGSRSPVWARDGSTLAYAVRHTNGTRLAMKSASGIGREESLLEVEADAVPLAWTPDGTVLMYAVMSSLQNGRLWVWSRADKKTSRLLGTDFNEFPAAFSPDGRWLAYVSSETGPREVYVTSYPNATGKWPISTQGGENPRWSHDGRHLFFIEGDRMMRADVRSDQGRLIVDTIKPLFAVQAVVGRGVLYDVAPDGRLLVSVGDAQPGVTPITLLVNWPQLGGGTR